jgi:hypothetical protein
MSASPKSLFVISALSVGLFSGVAAAQSARELSTWDTNGDGVLSLNEWRGNRVSFNRLDVNRDGVLSRREMQASTALTGNFASHDIDGDGVIALREWNSSRQSFYQRDTNGDGVLSRREYNNNARVNQNDRVYENDAVRTARMTRDIYVNAREEWTNTGVFVQPGDVISVDASGTIRLSDDRNDTAQPQHGAPSGRRAPNGPAPDHSAGVLLVRVGNSVRYVGSNGSFTAPTNGEVYLGVNDDHFLDNGGGYRVMLTVDNR